MTELKPADVNGKRHNRAHGAVSAAEKAHLENDARPPKRHIPQTLDARVFAHRIGAAPDDEEDPILVQARHAYSALGENLADIHRREAAIMANVAATHANRLMSVDAVAKKRSDAPAGKLDSVRQQIKAAIEGIDREFDTHFRATLKPEEAREIRNYVASLSDAKRREFLAKEADSDTISAVLSGKSFLSGLRPAEATKLRVETIQKRFPGKLKQREKLEKAIEQIDTGWSIYLAEVTKLYHGEAAQIAEAAKAAAEAEA